MNISVPEIFSFSNTSLDTIGYDVDNSMKTDFLLIGPLIKILQVYMYSFVQQSEDTILNGLRPHEFGNQIFIRELFNKTLPDMATSYVLTVAGLFALIALPIVYAKRCCRRRSINLYKCQACFCVEGFLLIITCVLLLFGAVSSVQTVIYVDQALQSQPALGRGIIHDLQAFSKNLRSQLNIIKEDYDMVLDFVLKLMTDLPDDVTDIVRNHTDSISPNLEKHFNTMYNTFGKAVHNTDIFSNYTMVFHMALDEVEIHFQYIRLMLDQLKERVLWDKKLSQHERKFFVLNLILAQNKANFHLDRSNMTDSHKLSGKINHTLNTLMLQANDSVHFLEKLKLATKNAIENDIAPDLRKNIARIKRWTKSCISDFNAIAENVAPQPMMDSLTNLTLYLDTIFTYLDIKRGEDVVFSGRMALMLMLGAQSICVILTVAVGGIIGMHEVKQQNQIGSKTTIVFPPSFGARILRFGTLLSLSHLWLNFLIAGIGYFAATVVSLGCLPIMDLTIFTKYLDDPQVWSGRTWIDSQMENYTDNFTTGIKTTDVLESCSHHHTLFTAFNHNKTWNLEEKFNMTHLVPNEDRLASSICNTIEQLKLPDLNIGAAIITSLDSIQQSLEFNLTLQIQEEVKRFQSLKINENHLEKILQRLSDNPKYDYLQDSVRNISSHISRVETLILPRVLRPHDRVGLMRAAINQTKTEALLVSEGFIMVNDVISISVLPQTAAFVNLKAKVTNNYVKSFTQHAIMKIESQIGNCDVLFNLFVKAKWGVCEQGLTLLNAVWISHGVMAFATLLLILLGCRIASYFRGAQESAGRWSHRLHQKEKEEEVGIAVSSSVLTHIGMGDRYGHAKVVRSGGRQTLPRPGQKILVEEIPL